LSFEDILEFVPFALSSVLLFIVCMHTINL
jgi:hypothetical protein